MVIYESFSPTHAHNIAKMSQKFKNENTGVTRDHYNIDENFNSFGNKSSSVKKSYSQGINRDSSKYLKNIPSKIDTGLNKKSKINALKKRYNSPTQQQDNQHVTDFYSNQNNNGMTSPTNYDQDHDSNIEINLYNENYHSLNSEQYYQQKNAELHLKNSKSDKNFEAYHQDRQLVNCGGEKDLRITQKKKKKKMNSVNPKTKKCDNSDIIRNKASTPSFPSFNLSKSYSQKNQQQQIYGAEGQYS